MVTGTVASFDANSGFGYITPDDGGADLFVDFTAIVDADRGLRKGEYVSFEIGRGSMGLQATSVRLAALPDAPRLPVAAPVAPVL